MTHFEHVNGEVVKSISMIGNASQSVLEHVSFFARSYIHVHICSRINEPIHHQIFNNLRSAMDPLE